MELDFYFSKSQIVAEDVGEKCQEIRPGPGPGPELWFWFWGIEIQIQPARSGPTGDIPG